MGAHPLAPDRHRRLDLRGRDLGQRVHRVGRVDDHLVVAVRGLGGEQVRLAAAAGERILAGRGLARRQRRVEVRHHAHLPARVSVAPPRSQPVELGRRAVLVAGGERVGLGRSASRSGRRETRRAASRARRRRSPAARRAGRCAARAPARGRLSRLPIATCSMPSSTNFGPRSSYPRVEVEPARVGLGVQRDGVRAGLERDLVREPQQRGRDALAAPVGVDRQPPSRATRPRNSSRQVPTTFPSSMATRWVASWSRPSRSAAIDTPCSPLNTRSRSSSAAAISGSLCAGLLPDPRAYRSMSAVRSFSDV